LEVYYDAKNYSGSGDVQDETANNRDAEMNATFDNGEIKAFNFSGAYTSNVTTSDHGLGTGDVTYTMSYWFKRTAVAGTYDYLVILGTGGTAYSSSLMWINNNQLTLDHWGSALRVLEPIVLDKWYHVVAGHRGGVTPSLTNDFIYINGKQVTPQITQTAAPFTLAGSKLYAYQKEYFEHGDLGMTLKAGRLGIGTSEPRAMLDVRGVIKGTGALTTGLPWFYARNQTALTTGSTSYNVTSTHLQESNDVLGTMYSTSYACLFPIKGIYIFSAQVHSVFGSAHNAGFDGVVRYSDGSQYYRVYSPTKIGATDGNFDTHASCIFIITTNADNMYLDLNHYTSASVQRNYSGQWNRNWGVCIYAL
jgi:hypothetical protein